MYPKYAEIKGKKYKLNTSYKVALRCFEVIDDSDISETERAAAIIYLLFGFIPKKDSDLFLEKAKKFLECGEKVKEQEELRKKYNIDDIFKKKEISNNVETSSENINKLPIRVENENIFKRLLNSIMKFFNKKWDIYLIFS